ncbi:MAG: oligosaccharide flippase family protein [Catenulispora sp.]|nr:oligosaccharide flippase family protein [Catenulispora sp.]
MTDATMASKVKKGLAWSTINSLALRAGSFAVGILLAHLLAPKEFGVFAVALTVQSIIVTLADPGISVDLIRNGDVERRAATTTTLALMVSGVLAVIMAVFAGPVSSALGSGDAAPVVRVMAFTLLLSGLSTVPYAKMQREFRQSAQLAVDATTLIVNVLVILVLVPLGMGAMALAVARVVSQGCACVLQFVLTRSLPAIGFNRDIARGVLKFGIPLASANLLAWIVLNVDYMVVGSMAGAVVLGFYTLAFNISSWPLNSLGTAIRSVALPAFSQLGDAQRQVTGFLAATALGWAAALGVGVGLSGLAMVLITLVYGDKWEPATPALAGLAFFGALRVIFDLAATFLIAKGSSRSILFLQGGWLILLVPAMAIGTHQWGLAGAGWAHVAVAAVAIAPMYFFALRRHGIHLGPVLRQLIVPALCAALSLGVGIPLIHHLSNRFVALFVGGIVLLLLYAVPMLPWLRGRLRDLKAAAAAAPAPEPEPPPNLDETVEFARIPPQSGDPRQPSTAEI